MLQLLKSKAPAWDPEQETVVIQDFLNISIYSVYSLSAAVFSEIYVQHDASISMSDCQNGISEVILRGQLSFTSEQSEHLI